VSPARSHVQRSASLTVHVGAVDDLAVERGQGAFELDGVADHAVQIHAPELQRQRCDGDDDSSGDDIGSMAAAATAVLAAASGGGGRQRRQMRLLGLSAPVEH
jgi:hypothetical protein